MKGYCVLNSLSIWDRAQKRLWKRLVAILDEKQRARIAKLFD